MGNKDFIDRKVEGVETLFNLAVKDVKSLIIVLSILCNIYLGHKVIKTNEDMRKEIVNEIRRQVPAEVKRETNEQLLGITSKVDTVLNTSREAIKYLGK